MLGALNLLRIAIVVSRFNEEITARLLRSAQETVTRHPAAKVSKIVHVPGAFEIPIAARWLAQSREAPDAIICLGAVIRGKTDQNFHLVSSCYHAIQQVQADTGIPIGCGIICANTMAQARQRAKGKLDRGREAAEAALAMAQLKKKSYAYGIKKNRTRTLPAGALSDG